MLRTLRLRLADRPEFDLSFAPTDDSNDPWELLKSRADPEGRIRLGDRESCSIDEVLGVTVVEPERLDGPTWERGLKDEDVATALDENYDAPS
jgi:hypothetical protein